MEEGLEENAAFLADYLRKHRRELAELTEAHTRATYGLAEYDQREAELLLKIAESVITVL
ncbi:MAG: hypothetical protein J7L98_04665 [Candidatus Verstraetearchaeota archaeon]|nr:hypothetical protein [Candidatus Verstraetearchaeota archaeon]